METTINCRFEFRGIDCVAEIGRYQSGFRTALKVVAVKSKRNFKQGVLEGMEVAIASINIPLPLKANEVVIFDYQDNTGILNALLNASVVSKTGRKVSTQYGLHEIVRINGVQSTMTVQALD